MQRWFLAAAVIPPKAQSSAAADDEASAAAADEADMSRTATGQDIFHQHLRATVPDIVSLSAEHGTVIRRSPDQNGQIGSWQACPPDEATAAEAAAVTAAATVTAPPQATPHEARASHSHV